MTYGDGQPQPRKALVRCSGCGRPLQRGSQVAARAEFFWCGACRREEHRIESQDRYARLRLDPEWMEARRARARARYRELHPRLKIIRVVPKPKRARKRAAPVRADRPRRPRTEQRCRHCGRKLPRFDRNGLCARCLDDVEAAA